MPTDSDYLSKNFKKYTQRVVNMQLKDFNSKLENINPDKEVQFIVNGKTIDYKHIYIDENKNKIFITIDMPISQNIQIVRI